MVLEQLVKMSIFNISIPNNDSNYNYLTSIAHTSQDYKRFDCTWNIFEK